MGSSRMEMKFIESDEARKKVFKTRRTNLLKKAKELSILCDIKILLIIYELDKQKPEIWNWPDNDEEAEQIINRFKQQSVRGYSKKVPHPFASKKKRFGDKFTLSDYKNMINHFSENQLQTLCRVLDANIASVLNSIKSKQFQSTEGPRSPDMLVDSEGIGLLTKGKGKEVVINQDPVHDIPQDQSFKMLSHYPNFMESPTTMMQNGIRDPEFDGSSSSRNSPYVPYQYPNFMESPSMMIQDGISYPEFDGSSSSSNIPYVPSQYPNFMESPSMMMQNGISYPEFDGSSSSSNIPYVPSHYPNFMENLMMMIQNGIKYQPS
ncbi:hypothetical protein REPUB_Repub12eG0027900 [Reevesia pubescens]